MHNCNPVKYGWATCLPHKGGGVPFNALPKGTTSKLAGLFSTLSLFMLSAKQRSCKYQFLKSFDLGNETQVYRLQCGRSRHYTIAPVLLYSIVTSPASFRIFCQTGIWSQRSWSLSATVVYSYHRFWKAKQVATP